MQCDVDIEGIEERMSYRDCHVGKKWAIRCARISQRPQRERMGMITYRLHNTFGQVSF